MYKEIVVAASFIIPTDIVSGVSTYGTGVMEDWQKEQRETLCVRAEPYWWVD